MKKQKLHEHLLELKSRIVKILFFFIFAFGAFYYFKEDLYRYLVLPLGRKVIYTGLAEAFFTHLKLSAFAGFCASLPVIAFQIYKFIEPGLYKGEKKIAFVILFFSPILFFFGGFFVYFIVIPKAWHFFLSFELPSEYSPLVLEPRISEYLDLVIQLTMAFGLAFELPIVLMIMVLIGVLDADFLVRKRRLAIVVNFVIAGIITPPDAISQIALAVPMVLLYEISIVLCKTLENRKKNARYKMD
ncbi:MAG: twin-arginine translocase subunit TatC [Rickettsiaceae bacterium]|nr:twin-arginine translocase subunit TatC [Rickettsiaceae bacterium]